MRIGLIASIWISVPPKYFGFGAQEYLASVLADGLSEKGHSVVLFASGGSATRAALHSVVDQPVSTIPSTDSKLKDMYEILNVSEAISQSSSFDILANHLLPYGLPFAPLTGVPVVHTLHHQVYPTRADHVLYDRYRTQPFVSISDAQRLLYPTLRYIQTVYNGTDTTYYQFEDSPTDEYLTTITRLKPYKGIHTAIEVAHQLGQPLKVAAPLPRPHQPDYDDVMAYWQTIKSSFRGQAEYLGEVVGVSKVGLLQQAKAFLFPIERDEPFGMTLIEAMACGTPVIAFGRGSVKEIVVDGVTGYVVPPSDGVPGLVRAMQRLNALTETEYRAMRLACRTRVEQHFSSERMVNEYEKLFESIVTGRPHA
jgi:glycosyltransferase involved in cell wall biosynthesis